MLLLVVPRSFLIFGQQHAPTRGPLSLYAYQWITFFLIFATLFLVFFVADTTLSVLGAGKDFS